MKFTVLWSPTAEAELARLWNTASDRAAVTAAANQIDELLRNSAEDQGESRAGAWRILFVDPLVVCFDVKRLDQTVLVWAIGRSRSRPLPAFLAAPFGGSARLGRTAVVFLCFKASTAPPQAHPRQFRRPAPRREANRRAGRRKLARTGRADANIAPCGPACACWQDSIRKAARTRCVELRSERKVGCEIPAFFLGKPRSMRPEKLWPRTRPSTAWI